MRTETETAETTALRDGARAQSGMTLLEIMIVLAIIGLIMGVLVGPRIFKALSSAKKDTGDMAISQLHDQYPQWQHDHENDPNQCPDDLVQQMIKQKYIKWKKVSQDGAPIDNWGTPIKIKCPGDEDKDGIDVSSAGPDRKWDTADDINSWKL